MSMFSKLFELLPDAENLLSLQPEELAGPLLISLEEVQRIDPEGLIAYRNMRQEIDNNSQINYPNGYHEDVLLVIMEAWQCLLSEGFVAQKPNDLPSYTNPTSTTKYFVTRRGKKIETLEDFKAYRKADLLRKHQLHPIIAQKVWSLFLQGDYDTAVFQAFKQVEVAVREVGYYPDTEFGVSLMRNAFRTDDGNLTDENQQQAEKEARSNLFAGAIGSYKNPSSHRNVEMTAEEAVEIIIFASHLLRIVYSRNQADGDWQEQFANRFVRHLEDRGSPLMDPEVFMGEDARGYPRYIGFNIGKIENLDIRDRNAIWLVASTVHAGRVYLKLHMNDSNCFYQLELQKAAIQREFGDPLKWEQENKPHRIGVDHEVNPLDKNRGQWNQYFEEMREKLEKLNEIFQPHIEDFLSEDDIPVSSEDDIPF